jgi:polyhydroxyalkanoate synthase
VSQYSGDEVEARKPGDGKLKPLADAPGTYVMVRSGD